MKDIVTVIRSNPEAFAPQLMQQAADEIELLRIGVSTALKERDEARRLYCEKMSPGDPPKHAEKWRWDCYGEFDQVEKLRWRLEESIEERDAARREVCNMMHKTGFFRGDYADSRGWDCFKEDGK